MSRGYYGSGTPRVAGLADRLRIDHLTDEWNASYQAIAEQAKARPDWSGWFTVAVEPVWRAWSAFRQGAGEAIDPTVYATWSNRLAVIRAGAKGIGMKPPTSFATVGLIGGAVVLGLTVLAIATSESA